MHGGRKKLLIVEDDSDQIFALQEIFSTLKGVRILTASNGAEGVKMAENELPDLIVLDIIMPTMDGIEALEIMRKIEALKETPAIILMNIETNELMKRADDLNIAAYFVKVDTLMSEVLSTISKILQLEA